MTTNTDDLSRTAELASRLLHAAMSAIKENGGSMKRSEVMEEVEKRVELDDWAKQRLEKTDHVRWKSVLMLHSINAVKAQWIVKKRGVWHLTEEGRAALKLDPAQMLKRAKRLYRNWKAKRTERLSHDNTTDDELVQSALSDSLDQVEQMAMDAIKNYIGEKNAYEFQDLVAALLRGMGYHTPFVAPLGKDGGIDIIAFRDPFGIDTPRIKVQVKHRQSASSVQEIRQLVGILQKDDVGLFVSTGGFTADAKRTATSSHVHLQLIDLDEFIRLWKEFYKKMADEDRSLLPLYPVYFVAPSD